jgi:hypothetical protein
MKQEVGRGVERVECVLKPSVRAVQKAMVVSFGRLAECLQQSGRKWSRVMRRRHGRILTSNTLTHRWRIRMKYSARLARWKARRVKVGQPRQGRY